MKTCYSSVWTGPTFVVYRFPTECSHFSTRKSVDSVPITFLSTCCPECGTNIGSARGGVFGGREDCSRYWISSSRMVLSRFLSRVPHWRRVFTGIRRSDRSLISTYWFVGGDLDETERIFLSSGFELEHGHDELAQHEFHVTFRDRQGIPIEIHWAIARPWHFFDIDTDRFWQRKETTLIAGKPVPSLSPEDLLLALSVHGVRHHWRGLRWICDIGRLLERYKERDWLQTIKRAKPISQRRILLLSLLLASELTGAKIHRNVYRAARTDPVVRSLAWWVRGQLFSDEESFSWRLRSKLYYFRLTSGAYRRLRLLLSMVSPTPTDVNYRQLPPVFSVLYYVIRPIRFIRECDLWSSSHH